MRSTDARFLELLRRHMGTFRVHAESVDEANELLFSADCGVERSLPGGKTVRGKLTLYAGTAAVYRGRDISEMAARVVSYARMQATYYQDEFVRLRAGAVALDGRAIILPSPPERHLAALVGILVRGGASYLGDEQVHIDPVLRNVHGTGLPLLIDSEDFGLFPDLAEAAPPRRGREPVGKGATTPRRLVGPEDLGAARSGPAPVGWIVFPYFEDGSPTRLEPAGGSEAMFRFTQGGLNLHVWGERGLLLMREMVESAPVSRLVVGSLLEAGELVLGAAPELMEEVGA